LAGEVPASKPLRLIDSVLDALVATAKLLVKVPGLIQLVLPSATEATGNAASALLECVKPSYRPWLEIPEAATGLETLRPRGEWVAATGVAATGLPATAAATPAAA
jgi:hypothetical protein